MFTRGTNRFAAAGIVSLLAIVAAIGGAATPRTDQPGSASAAQVRAALVATKPGKPAAPRKPTRTIEAAAPKGLSPTAIRVAVIDTGVTPIAPLASRLLGGVDLVDATGVTTDRNGHGTAMASIAHGVCGACAIVPVRALADTGTGTADLAAQAVRWATADGARVINLSLTSPDPDDALTAAIETAVADGVVVVVAAGNSSSTDPAAQGYPGAAVPDALTIASVDPSGRLSPWSNHGSWVHLAAPGVSKALTTTGETMNVKGTSGSAAYVSGVAGLLLTCNPSLTPTQLTTALLASAGPSSEAGLGLVNPTAALAAVAPAGGCAA